MSLASWKKEFYRTPANKVSKRYALKHSIKKWIGLLRKNKEKHDVTLYRNTLADTKDNELYIDSRSCALCEIYNDDCTECPLASVGNNTDLLSPCSRVYKIAIDTKIVIPMIKLLQKAQQKQKGKVK